MSLSMKHECQACHIAALHALYALYYWQSGRANPVHEFFAISFWLALGIFRPLHANVYEPIHKLIETSKISYDEANCSRKVSLHIDYNETGTHKKVMQYNATISNALEI